LEKAKVLRNLLASKPSKSITSKANKRLWFLTKLKPAGVSEKDLEYYYETVIRTVLEYASPVCRTSLTANQTKTLEVGLHVYVL